MLNEDLKARVTGVEPSHINFQPVDVQNSIEEGKSFSAQLLKESK